MESRLWRARLSKGEVWAVGGANAQDPQGWKRPWGLWGWGLGSRNRSIPCVPPTPGLRGQGTSPGSPAGFLGSSGRGKCPPLLFCSFWRTLPTCLSWSPWTQGCRSCLASTSPPPSVPPCPTGSLGGSPISLGIRVPHQRPAGTLVVGRC